ETTVHRMAMGSRRQSAPRTTRHAFAPSMVTTSTPASASATTSATASERPWPSDASSTSVAGKGGGACTGSGSGDLDSSGGIGLSRSAGSLMIISALRDASQREPGLEQPRRATLVHEVPVFPCRRELGLVAAQSFVGEEPVEPLVHLMHGTFLDRGAGMVADAGQRCESKAESAIA